VTASPARILVVEDEDALAQGIVFNLKRKHYEVELASDGRQALERLSRQRFDLVLLDVRLPEVNGFEVCQRLRQDGNFVPVLMLTARAQPDDVVYGLKLGADDYVTKPFDLAELLARIEGLLRRQDWLREGREARAGETPPNGAEPPAGERVEFGEFWIDFRTWEAKTRDGIVQLSKKEVAAMRLFLSRPNQVISRRELLAEVWALPNHPNTRVVDNVIVSLRRAFEDDATHPRHLHNVRGVGYRFVP
jgi:DNA-binding response OmpR family regulator